MGVVTYEDYSADDVERWTDEKPASSADKRGPFERDRSRIVHSAAFRKLQGKTQVYGLGASDYYRTRLTHSLEVAQIGKALALNLAADPTLVEAICLAHDIGHPPFGHAGEYALHEAMCDFEGFNGNAQNIRILTDTERKSDAYEGLNLTKATLDGLIKYPWPIDPQAKVKKGFYKSDKPLVENFHDFSVADQKTFECEIMNWSDDVAYSSHDLEDALVIGTVRQEDLRSTEIRTRIYAMATEAYGKNYPEYERQRQLKHQDVESALADVIEQCIARRGDRLKNIKTFLANHISDCVTTAKKNSRDNPRRRYQFTLQPDAAMVRQVEIFKVITFACVIKTNAVLTLQQAGCQVVCDLYSAYSDAKNPDVRYWYPDDWILRVDHALIEVKTNDPFALKRLARDYVGTMTDRFAEEQWRRLKLPGEGQLFVARA